MITAFWETCLIAYMHVSPKAIWECVLDQGSENKVIDVDLPFIMLVILVNSVYSPWVLFSQVWNGDNKTDLCILPSQDYCRESNEFI